MDNILFMREFIRDTKATIPLRHDLQDEGRILLELDRAEQWASRAHERKLEENETNQIKAALEKEKHDQLVAKKRYQQLMLNTDELRHLRHFIATAETSKELMAQLKLQDETIEQRFEAAKREAKEIRAKYRADEERQRQIEEQRRHEGKLLRDDLKAQMEVHEMQRDEEMELKIKEGAELDAKMKALLEKDRLEQEEAEKAKIQLRQESLAFLKEREEQRRLANIKDQKDLLALYEAENRRAVLDNRIKYFRRWGFKRQEAISDMIGKEVCEVEMAKKQAITDLIDWYVNEQQSKKNKEYQQEIEKECETRQMLQAELTRHLERKQAEKERQHKMTMDIALQRKPLTKDEHFAPRRMSRRTKEHAVTAAILKEKLDIDQDTSNRLAEEKRKEYEFYIEQQEDRKEEIEAAKNELLNKLPIQLLRYLPSTIVRSDYLEEPLRQRVRAEVLKDPIPMLTSKRHQPHLLRLCATGGESVKCSKTCTKQNFISNIF